MTDEIQVIKNENFNLATIDEISEEIALNLGDLASFVVSFD